MHRNLDHRVEAIITIDQPALKRYLQFLLSVYLKDNQQRWLLNADGNYAKVERKKGEQKVSTHQILMNHVVDVDEPIPIVR
jgi:polyphosphate kinase